MGHHNFVGVDWSRQPKTKIVGLVGMYVVAGLGITGQSVLRYFQSQGQFCLAFDTRVDFNCKALQETFPQVTFATGQMPYDWLNQFEYIVLSPGISRAEPWVIKLVELGKKVIGDIEIFARVVNVPVIAITGSNGKSTVTTMTGMALDKAGYVVGVGGNIGEPVLDLLIDDKDYDVFVLELSSFQLETTNSLKSVSATVLNVSEDHMDRYVDFEDYVQAKTKVYHHTQIAVVPAELSQQGLIQHPNRVIFGLDYDTELSNSDYGVVQHEGQAWLGYGDVPQIPVSCMRLPGRHHQLNALAMLALCQPFIKENTVFREVVSEFKGLPHRTQQVNAIDGVDWVNDSKGTNVGATVTAIESIGEQTKGALILIAGGVGKDADFSDLLKPVNQYCKTVVLFGRDKQAIASALSEIEQRVDIIDVEDLSRAVAIGHELAVDGDCVLFSPACASFDQFSSFIDRGEAFIALVNQLASVR